MVVSLMRMGCSQPVWKATSSSLRPALTRGWTNGTIAMFSVCSTEVG